MSQDEKFDFQWKKISSHLTKLPRRIESISGLPIGSTLSDAQRTLDGWLHLAMDKSVRLAVTGLNKSGKTVFITALIHQLLHGLRGNSLTFFELAASKRFRGAKVMLPANLAVSAFPYERFIEPLLGSDPYWPTPTDGLSEIRLAIRYQPTGLVQKRLAPVSTLYLDIIDYPGEWLLDLPLLDLDFEAWSRSIFQICQEEPRRTLAGEWLAFLDGMDLNGPARESVMREASVLYTDFLMKCKKADAGLSFLQPGRFTMPGELKDTPLLTFCPLPADGIEKGGKHGEETLYQEMARRFESYKERVVRAFYRDHFSRFDRQIVLIDLLKALNNGYKCFADTRSALESTLDSFRYGPSGLIHRLFRPKIDKVLFAATKVDHVAANQHHNLERLLNRMIVKSANDAVFQGVEVRTMALSSVTCTRTVAREHHGRRLSFVQGIPKGRDQEVLLFPGEIPESIPRADEWDENRFNFMDFKPPRRADPEGNALPHIRLDQALEFLLGDKLQ